MTLDILGTIYNMLILSEKEMGNANNCGECDRYTKTIRINFDYFNQEDVHIEGKFKTIRHEIIHAFFHEAGLDCYAEDEILVDALAILYPKISKCIDEALFKEVEDEETNS